MSFTVLTLFQSIMRIMYIFGKKSLECVYTEDSIIINKSYKSFESSLCSFHYATFTKNQNTVLGNIMFIICKLYVVSVILKKFRHSILLFFSTSLQKYSVVGFYFSFSAIH